MLIIIQRREVAATVWRSESVVVRFLDAVRILIPNNLFIWVNIPHFLYLGTIWRWVVNFTPRSLYPRGKNSRYPLDRSRDSVVGIATSYGLGDRGVGVRIPVGVRIFTSPNRPDRLWGSPNLLPNGYQGLFSRVKAAGAWSWPLTSN
jgi:hypothetical protein